LVPLINDCFSSSSSSAAISASILDDIITTGYSLPSFSTTISLYLFQVAASSSRTLQTYIIGLDVINYDLLKFTKSN
jgi:hypothetical protein